MFCLVHLKIKYYMINIMEFVEYLDVDNCKYFINLPNDKIMAEMYDPLEVDQMGFKIKDIDGYINRIKQFCKKAIFNKGEVRQKYYYSQKLQNKGRLFVRGFGLQKCQNAIRGFLIDKSYLDYDMVNAAPTILKYLTTKYIPHKSYPNLTNYIKNRPQILNEYKLSKLDVICCIYNDKFTKNTDTFLRNLDKEFKDIQNEFFKMSLYPEIKDISKYNKKGSFLCHLVQIYENNILNECKANVQTSTLMFDGFTSNQNGVEVLTQLNKNNYGIEWINKPHNEDIQIDEGLVIENNILDYETVKINFEDTYFMVRNPVLFGWEYRNEEEKKEITFYNKSDFDILTQDILYDGTNKKTFDLEERNFLKDWLKDKKKRLYQRVEWIPNLTYDNDKIFNSFTGFNIFESPKTFNQEPVDLYLNHIKLLVNNDEDSFIYVRNYIAHLFQKPDELPATSLLFKSQQGLGKDLLTDIIEAILGSEYMAKTSNTDTIFGNFNAALKHTLVLQLNELQGSDGFANKEYLKDLITSRTLTINEKNLKPYKQANYTRVFIFSNNLNPIEIPHDDRRFCVFKGGRNQNTIYYNKLVDILEDSEALKSILHYFKNVDINNFSLRNNRPVTSAYEDMKQNSKNPLYQYLYNLFTDDEYKLIFKNDYVIKSNYILIKSKDLYCNYKSYLDEEGLDHIKIDFKKMKNLFNDVGIQKKSAKINKKVNDYYFIKKQELMNDLETRNLIEEAEEIFI